MSSIKVGFIGLGNMGMPTARSLVKRGLPVTVYDVRKEVVEEIVALGAKSAGSCGLKGEIRDHQTSEEI